ncbi:MAG: ABC transporter substrate-binding protein [Spirochaetaceae bacterium]|nr:MAG: ABC transporter substrate-binding protein [Spirochaetaceae bacterium]
MTNSRDRASGRRLRVVIAACLITIAAGVLPAAGVVEEAPTRTVTDALGRVVAIPTDPARIVIAGRAVMMTANALYMFPGASDRIVGIGRIDQGKGNFLPAIDRTYGSKAVLEQNVGAEQVAGLSPDLVILKSMMKESLGDGLERLGVPVVYIDLETPEQYQRDLRLLGQIVGQTQRGEELAQFYAEQTERVRAEVARVTGGGDGSGGAAPRTLFLYANVSGGQTVFNIPPVGWIQTSLVEMAGGAPVWVDENRGGGWRSIGVEQIAAWNPQVITLVAYRQDVVAIRDSLLARELWSTLDAVRSVSFHVFPLDYYSWDQPDIRWILGLHWLARTLHPGAFADKPMADLVYSFFDFAYGMRRDQVDAVIGGVLEGIEL